MPDAAPSDPRRILIIRPSALGDVCRTVPVLASLKRAYPDADIDWLVQDTFVDAIAAHPDLHQAIPFPRRALANWYRSPRTFAQLTRFLRSLRSPHYDLVLDCQGLFRSALFTFATGAPKRMGYKDAPELAWLPLTHRVNAPRTLHTVDRMLALARAAGGDITTPDMTLYPPCPPPDQLNNLTPPLIVLAPTSRWPSKRWPDDRFAALASRLLDATDAHIAIVGSTSESNQVTALLNATLDNPRVINLMGRTSVSQLLAVIDRAALTIANDSAALHMAVGLSTPAVALFGPTDPTRVGPYQHNDDVIQHITPADTLDHKHPTRSSHIIERITVDEVFAAAISKLAATDQPCTSTTGPSK